MNDCSHTKIETLYQYDQQKNRTVFWACTDCRMKFYPAEYYSALEARTEDLEWMLAKARMFVRRTARTRNRFGALADIWLMQYKDLFNGEAQDENQ